jgi:hypothetical protein
VGGLISHGEFCGRVVYVTGPGDVPKCGAGSLVLLGNCPKDIAVDALQNSPPAINLTGALTAHLTCGRTTLAPFAVAGHWPGGLPAEGEEVTIGVEQETFGDSLPPLPDIPIRYSDPVLAGKFGGKGAGLIMLEELGFHVPDYLLIAAEEISQ